MILFGNRGGSRYSGTAGKKGKKTSAKKVILIIVIILIVLAAAAFAVWHFAVRPPDVSNTRGDGGDMPGIADMESPGMGDTTQAHVSGRNDGEYTFVVLGTDDGNGNTDTIMVANFDTVNYKLNVVSIPRDTLVNVSWPTKKVNSLYGVGGVERTVSGLGEIMGFEPDFYALVNLKAFEKLVDAVGGIYYNVPVNMNYEDPAQNLYIHIAKGYQTLMGSEAVKVMRFRSGYSDADIGRIGTQQDFLKTAAEQIMANKDKINISTLAEIFINYVDTDLTKGNVVWFAKEFLKMDGENINFMTLPANYWDSVYGASYVTIYVDEWVDMVNEYLNPYKDDVEVSDLNILTRTWKRIRLLESLAKGCTRRKAANRDKRSTLSSLELFC
ncbi:MAG: LCP family protein, partial [Oscillospiraceae bacterium]|nr:LCP family protein [Oscillospiraceae bacterium]